MVCDGYDIDLVFQGLLNDQWGNHLHFGARREHRMDMKFGSKGT
jgi:hypothetical protein